MLRVGRDVCGFCRFELVASEVDNLLRQIVSARDQLSRALIIGSGEFQIALALDDLRVRFRERLFGFQDLRLRPAQLGFGFRRRDGCDHLSRGDLVALIHGQRHQPARIFRGDVDLRGLNSPVRFDDALRHVAAAQLVDERVHGCLGPLEGGLLIGLRPGGVDHKRAARQTQRAGHGSDKDRETGGSIGHDIT